ncbi:MAG: N-acetylneuraminate synthase [Thermoanaerobaculales bacterium]|nr:N-acetylneuraminate synthase [Thermoanaerobaculales bacterium]
MNDSHGLATKVRLGDRVIGFGHPVFVIAEAGVNHNGDIELARRLIDVAAAAGADAVKFQTFRADKVISASAPQAEYQKANTGKAESQLEMVRRLELGPGQTRHLRDYCDEAGIEFLSSPFDEESADLLEELGVSAFKVGSGELTNHRFLAHLARKGNPMLLSTGMATEDEVAVAFDLVGAEGCQELCLLHCVSAYPAPPAESNLRAMDSLRRRFGVPVGWSDHTPGIHVSLAAVALGSSVIEKHFTLDRSMPGPDHAASLEPRELTELVRQVREIESALGDGVKRCMPSEENTAEVARRSVHVTKDLVAGHLLRADDLVALRPGTGIPVDHLNDLIGRPTRTVLRKGQMLGPNDVG